MDLKLRGRRALVTGSSSGLGQAIAAVLAEEGAEVVVHGRDEGRATAAAAAIRAAGGRATVAVGDLATDEGAAAVAAAATAGGPVDILVNNAGAYDYLSWTQATPQIWADLYQNNVISYVRMIQALVPAMRSNGWGRVIGIGGALAHEPIAMQPHYNAALAARHNLAVSLSRELKGSGVTSNTVAPGLVLVDAVQRSMLAMGTERGWGRTWEEIEPAAAENLAPNDAGRLGRPTEIAAAVAYLASDAAAYITGTTLHVDGGVLRSIH